MPRRNSPEGFALYRAWDDQEVPDGSSFTFPDVPLREPVSRLFRIENHGPSPLKVSNHQSLVSGAGFSQIETPAATVPPGGQTTFRVRFKRGAAGTFAGRVRVDTDRGRYHFRLAGSAGESAAPVPTTAQPLFALSPAERSVWTPARVTGYLPPPTCALTSYSWSGTEGGALKYCWDSFCFGEAGAGPPDPAMAQRFPQWFDPDGSGSQNHALVFLGAAALGHALRGQAAPYDQAAEQALRVLALDLAPGGQGHMRHEAVGQYSGFWEGGIAAMALAGQHAPRGASRGAELLAAARAWWRDHVAVLRKLRLPDGQVALVGARIGGGPGYVDSRVSLSAAVNLQLVDPLPYGRLHPWIRALVTADGEPSSGDSGPDGLDWREPREVVQRWIVLRAVQGGALKRVPADQPVRCLEHRDFAGRPANVYRWTANGRTHTALPFVFGLGMPGVRWHVSWGLVAPHPASVLRVEAGSEGGPNGKGPHRAPDSVRIPPGAEILVPGC